MTNKHVDISVTLVRQLIDTQFPQWKDLSIRAVAKSGWDNRTFHLGDHMLVRMPSAADYALGVLARNRRNFRTFFRHNRLFRITQENIVYY